MLRALLLLLRGCTRRGEPGAGPPRLSLGGQELLPELGKQTLVKEESDLPPLQTSSWELVSQARILPGEG